VTAAQQDRQARPAHQAHRDHRPSAPAPVRQWWKDAVVYQIYPRSFADSDGNGIGDLAGIISRVPYLAALGVDAVWLSPFYPSALADGGYDVDDYRDVAPEIGTLADFDRMVAALHAAGIKVMVDIVPNHSSNRHPWFRAALAGGPDAPERALYHVRPGTGSGGTEPPNDWRSMFGGSAWERIDDVGPGGAPPPPPGPPRPPPRRPRAAGQGEGRGVFAAGVRGLSGVPDGIRFPGVSPSVPRLPGAFAVRCGPLAVRGMAASRFLGGLGAGGSFGIGECLCVGGDIGFGGRAALGRLPLADVGDAVEDAHDESDGPVGGELAGEGRPFGDQLAALGADVEELGRPRAEDRAVDRVHAGHRPILAGSLDDRVDVVDIARVGLDDPGAELADGHLGGGDELPLGEQVAQRVLVEERLLVRLEDDVQSPVALLGARGEASAFPIPPRHQSVTREM